MQQPTLARRSRTVVLERSGSWSMFRKRRAFWLFGGALLLFAWARWAPMDPLFDAPLSTVLEDRDGRLLGASVAPDGQWRFPGGPVPERFATCLIQFEDRSFFTHWGIRPLSLIRAFQQNRKAGRTVSGGSTITMQLARMSRGPRKRTYSAKLMEMLLAVRIELRYSKQEILAMYAHHAPFGGNVVGLDAAAWRWFGRAPTELSWAESATLAVLPNAPSSIYPGKAQDALRSKRDRNLDRLLEVHAIDSTEWALAKQEPLPPQPLPLPALAPHLLATLSRQGHAGERIRSTLDAALQSRVSATCERHAPRLEANEVHNAAALIIHVPTGEVHAYLGNLSTAGPSHAGQVDIIRAQRSTGSLLKPFLYADMLQSGELLPHTLVADVPTRYEGFRPRNFDETYMGAVPASEALARSLNIPAVRALREHGVDRTLRTLRSIGFNSIDRSADHYGLSLIVGGAESSLWEIAGAYASMGRILLTHGQTGVGQRTNPVHPPLILGSERTRDTTLRTPLSAASVYATISALQQVRRPDEEAGWRSFSDQQHISWKTGTSFGHRDAWAIGLNDRWLVAVWAGNATGEGRPGLTGTLVAAPLLFDLFRLLPRGDGFEPPYDDMVRRPVCRVSGFLSNPDCEQVDSVWIQAAGVRTRTCPYHRVVNLSADGRSRVPFGEGAATVWFSLPPGMERYYAPTHPAYEPLPPSRSGAEVDEVPMEVLYPDRGGKVLIPIGLDGTRGKAVVELAHRDPDARVHWDLDGAYLLTTTGTHQHAVEAEDGPHTLTFTDDHGAVLRHSFVVVATRP